MRVQRTAVLTMGIVLGLGITGCGSGSGESDGATSARQEGGPAVEGGGPSLANPVEILQKIPGCKIPKGTEVGDTDIDGNLYASCHFKDNSGTDGTDVTVRTFAGDPAQLATAEELSSDDSHKVIVGDDFTATITGDWSSYSAHIDPSEIAALVGGTYTPRG